MQPGSLVGLGYNVLLLVVGVCLVVLVALIFIGSSLIRARGVPWSESKDVMLIWDKYGSDDIVMVLEEWTAKQNDVWTSYGQFILSAFVIAVVTIMLLTKAISPEAGLPILAGVGGFAIGKSTSSRSAGRTSPVTGPKKSG